jgi:hypothetical protein
MSDSWLQFIPVDAEYQPSPEAAEHARVLLGTFTPEADTVSFEFKPSVEFFHPGTNWSGVECPACGADAELWGEGGARRLAGLSNVEVAGIWGLRSTAVSSGPASSLRSALGATRLRIG